MGATTVNNNHAAIRLAASTLWLHHLKTAKIEPGDEPKRIYIRELADAVILSSMPLVADSVMKLVVNTRMSVQIANQMAGTLIQIAAAAREKDGSAKCWIGEQRKIGNVTMREILDLSFPGGFDEFVKVAQDNLDHGVEDISPRGLLEYINRATVAGTEQADEGIRQAAVTDSGNYWAAVLVAPLENKGQGPHIRSEIDNLAYQD